MNIAIIGSGKMGIEVEEAVKKNGDTVSGIFNSSHTLNTGSFMDVDACIDFSFPDAAVNNMQLAATCAVDFVQGTTGWYEHLEHVKSWFTNSALIYAQNFSVGMNLFYQIIKHTAGAMDAIPDYDPYIVEHHNHDKPDAPSGTGLHIGEILLESIQRKTRIQIDPSGGVPEENLHIASIRSGRVPATHTVGFESEGDTIELRHVSKNRSGFALGALKAAHWVHGRKGVYTISDMGL